MTPTTGVILYGPPGAGKDTITQALVDRRERFTSFRRIKHGPGRTQSYRMVTSAQLRALHLANDVVWQNEQYSASYVVDRVGLLDELARGIPILHLGQTQAINAVTQATPGATWFVVYVWCPRDVAVQRIKDRGNVDLVERMSVWDKTAAPQIADLTLDTSTIEPSAAAGRIAGLVHAR
jgi:guanylate kinase